MTKTQNFLARLTEGEMTHSLANNLIFQPPFGLFDVPHLRQLICVLKTFELCVKTLGTVGRLE